MFVTVEKKYIVMCVIVQKKYIVMCVTVQKKYIPVMLLRAYRAAGLRVKMLKDNIEMGIKEMTIMTGGLKLILTIFDLTIKDISHNTLHKTTNTLTS
jgi:hypothetical protein